LNSRYTLIPAILAVGFLTFAVVVADLGTAIVLVLTAAVVFFVAGLEKRYIGIAAIVALLVCIGAVWQTQDTNYQSEQAKIAVGSGGPVGVGLMEGRQKLFYLPEAHTDTIYAVIGEEWGLFGTAGVLLGFVIILWRGVRATVRIHDEFGRYLALGITTLLVVQAFFNMSVVLGIFPTKGFPLPMISFGGSSLLVTLISLGILMNVSENAG